MLRDLKAAVCRFVRGAQADRRDGAVLWAVLPQMSFPSCVIICRSLSPQQLQTYTLMGAATCMLLPIMTDVDPVLRPVGWCTTDPIHCPVSPTTCVQLQILTTTGGCVCLCSF